MRKLSILVLVIVQLATFAALVYQRETLLNRGQRIFLRTAPVDPRDPLRGDFVRLSYPFNLVERSRFRGPQAIDSLQRGQRLYAVLEQGTNRRYELAWLQSRRPEQGLFLQGRLMRVDDRQLQLAYGIEKYFVEQDSGREIERRRRDDGVNMEVEVAVDKRGATAITGYRWMP